MLYFLLHLSTFVPILAKILVSSWGLKISWIIYLFFTYVLLEHKPFNGYPIKAFSNLQRQAECCLIGSLFVAYWVSSVLAPFTFLALIKAKGIDVDSLSYAFVFFLLFRFDLFQIALVAFSIMSALLQDTEAILATPDGWHRACTRRIMFRSVQVFALVSAYEGAYTRVLLVIWFVFLKIAVFLYTPEDRPSNIDHKEGDPIKFLQSRRHFL
jgi:hypothetical protein